ncbi:MAG: tRNA lysidine(34) synthetase TilS [Rhizobiaceae bacterium]|nr:tRNA lysidine(34) synthetase TilS [Rhizobiaceae bacterium]
MSGDAVTGVVTAEAPEEAAARFLRSLHKPAHVLVAVSGGSDSTGLLAALAERLRFSPNSDITLSAASIDHGLRAESAAETLAVASLCASLCIPHVIRRWDGEKPKNGIMAAAREARYGLLAGIAAEMSATVIVTAHTFDDQRETLAMRASRVGAGEGGMGTGIADAMLFDRRIWIARPFLRCRRNDIRAYLTTRHISWIDDPSNEDMHYERVRTRKDLVEDCVAILDDGTAVRRALAEKAADWFGRHATVHAAALCAIDRKGLDAEEAVLAYALSHLAAVFGGEPYGPGRDRMRRILDFIGEGEPGRRTAGGVVFDLRRDGLYLMRESRGIQSLELASEAAAIWDGRFRIANHSDSPIRIEAAGAKGEAIFPEGLPRGAMRRARAALPQIVSGGDDGSVAIMPYLAPFDRFLTRFDLTFANRLAAAFVRQAYALPPL